MSDFKEDTKSVDGASVDRVVMTPQLAARLIDAVSCGDHEGVIYESIVGTLCTIDDEVHCVAADVEGTDIVTRDVRVTLTHRDDAVHAKEIADFFLCVGSHLRTMRFRFIIVDVLGLEFRHWSS